ncbi:hypothetical protein FQR65_LT20280 [Abscondita terminalis]|nr:hypothetical protein FQR65_LT20280 [Abscondita terminalis]
MVAHVANQRLCFLPGNTCEGLAYQRTILCRTPRLIAWPDGVCSEHLLRVNVQHWLGRGADHTSTKPMRAVKDFEKPLKETLHDAGNFPADPFFLKKAFFAGNLFKPLIVRFPANSAEVQMGPMPIIPESGQLFAYPLREHINLRHPIVQLADLIDWQHIDAVCSSGFTSSRGRPATSPRLIAGLLYLQHAFDLSDEEVVWGWVENPYWQVFTGQTYLQTEPPIDPSSLTRWRQRLGEAGVEELLAATVQAGKQGDGSLLSLLPELGATTRNRACGIPFTARRIAVCVALIDYLAMSVFRALNED